jgi:tRNA dimethylallyltransferase
MFAAGLVEETRRLLGKYEESAQALKSLGYKQAVQLIRGEIDAEEALRAAQQAHRNYAKRQMTWFRREPDVTWFSGFGDELEIQKSILASLEALVVKTQY